MIVSSHSIHIYLFPIKLCLATSNKVLDFKEFVDFFIGVWAPRILEVHKPSGNIISTFVTDVTVGLEMLPTHKVKPEMIFCSLQQ